MMLRRFLTIGFILGALALAGCATRGGALPNPEGQGAGPSGKNPQSEGGGKANALGGENEFKLNPLQNPDSPLAKRVIYFDYDSDKVDSKGLKTIEAHGKYLSDNPDQTVRLEGHTDERGSREYNLGLGERRAESVRRLLELQGVADDQIDIISYGEELPAAPGHDEASWRLNRRVKIVYKGQ